MPTPVWSPLLICVALVCVVISVRERKRRRYPGQFVRELALPPWLGLHPGTVLVTAAAATMLTLPVAQPLEAVVRSPAGAIAVVVVGFAIGTLGLPVIGLGAAVCALLWGPEPALVEYWALPIVLGYLVRLAHINPMHWRGYAVTVAMFEQQGLVIKNPMPAERLWRAGQFLSALGPLGAVALAAMSGGTPLEQGARWVGALLVAAQLTRVDWDMRRIPDRLVRMSFRISAVAGRVVVLALAASPAGGALAALWARTPALTGVTGGLILAACASFPWLALNAINRFDGNDRLRHVRRPLAIIRMPLSAGLIPVAVVAFHAASGLPVAAAVLAAVEALGMAAGRRRADMDFRQLRFAAGFLHDRDDRLLGRWLQDAILGRPGRPDHALIRALGGAAFLSAKGQVVSGQKPLGIRVAPELYRPLTGTAALRWTDLARRALDLVDTEVRPRYPERNRAALDAAQAAARADLSWSRAIVFMYAGKWADALEQWRDAATRHQRLGARHHELFARLTVMALLALALDRLADARREHARLDRAGPLPPALLRYRRIVDAAVVGPTEQAGPPTASVAGRPADIRGLRRILAADPGLGGLDPRRPLAAAALIAWAEAAGADAAHRDVPR
jgi:hypothetical protein